MVIASEDEPEGPPLLSAARDNCSGPLSLLPPAPAAAPGGGGGAAAGYGERLASAQGRGAVAAVLTEALGELLQLI